MAQPTILDVAARAGVSKSLVSLVLRDSPSVSPAKRKAVLAAAAALDYRPNLAARSLVRRRSNVLGVMLSDLHNTFFADVLDGIGARAAAVGYKALVNTGNRAAACSSARDIGAAAAARAGGCWATHPPCSPRRRRSTARARAR
jgi:DNA-binding LacI/PurR family transcriptional regulator